ncbi:MAG: MoxR family ATPase [Chloroflexota bacterium]
MSKKIEDNLKKAEVLSIRILDEVEKAIVGKRKPLEKILTAIFSSGHILIEDLPGLGKTMITNSIAQTLGLEFKRVQFTPDLLPTDITGGYIFDRDKGSFVLRQGPIFANIILADEINRASPKTQSALLEAMQENQVTLEGETMSLPDPFIVIATQNPIEYEGTFPLPEAQLDRFLVKVKIGYPTPSQEIEILQRRHERQTDEVQLEQVSTVKELLEVRKAIETVHIAKEVERYIVEIINNTRDHDQIAIGASPRASLALLKLSRTWAALQGRNYVIPDDVKHFVLPTLEHRLILKPDLWLDEGAASKIIQEILDSVPVPLLESE